MANYGTEDAVVIEVQMGHSLREDDIERVEDRYGRM
jgi:mannose-6-phosphate isomerase-like protein (cupin superfamily)